MNVVNAKPETLAEDPNKSTTMVQSASLPPSLNVDWRITLGTILTFLWIGTGILYLFGKVGWVAFVNLPTADIGSFLEGAFAPLAFLWLVIGHFMQQKEISANTLAIQIQQQSAERLEIHAQRESYFKLSALIQDQLNNICAFHYFSVCGVDGTGEVSLDEFIQLRKEASGDPTLFVRKMIELTVTARREDGAGLQEVYFGTDIRTRHSDRYHAIFSKLYRTAQAVDHEDMVSDALLNGSAFGFLYRVNCHARGDDIIDPFTGTAKP